MYVLSLLNIGYIHPIQCLSLTESSMESRSSQHEYTSCCERGLSWIIMFIQVCKVCGPILMAVTLFLMCLLGATVL